MLPFPDSPILEVFTDSPELSGLRPWQFPRHLLIARYAMPTDSSGNVLMTAEVWQRFSAELTANHPGCVYCYY